MTLQQLNDGKDVSAHLRHVLCDTEVEHVMRTVVTRPDDLGWPADARICLPYCPTCQALVDIGELRTTAGKV